MSSPAVKRAVVPANTLPDEPMIGVGRRVRVTGTLKVVVPDDAHYRPPDGWRITTVSGRQSNGTDVHLKQE
jgi:hypothetical protein